jgi:Fe-S oxidoreductase
MQSHEATSYVSKCFNGEPASCSFACPFSLDIRSFLEKVSRGRWLPAYKLLRNAVVFPAVVAALCDQPCRGHCQRTQLGDEALNMSALEKASVKYTKSRKTEQFVIPPKTQRVAVVGAGPAGLACALGLALKKFIVTVYEKDAAWGGSLRQHPKFAEFDEEFQLLFSGVEVEFRYNTEITTLGVLSGFDAVYLATGKGGDDFGLLAGWDSALLTTAEPKVFLGGERSGVSLMAAIAQGNEAARILEGFLLSGSISRQPAADRSLCERYLTHKNAVSKPLVPVSDGETYTEEEARAEAARCLQCDCSYCEDSCEMLQYFRKKPKKIGLEVYTDSIATSVVSPKTMTRETYSCNVCGHCKSVCPVSVDIGALLQFSRADRHLQGKDIPAFHDYWLREFDFYRTAGFFAAPPRGKSTCDYAFFPGCRLGAGTPDHVIKSYEYLNDKFGAGLILGCCGAPAYWAGDEERLKQNIAQLRESWEKLGKPTLVFACAYCNNVFSMFMPDIPRVSLYEIMGADEALKPARPFETAAVFDPCTAREDAAMQDGVRRLARRSGAVLEELSDPNRCCGFGGHISLANPALYDQITTNRAEATDKPYIVYCANCRDVFNQKDKKCAHILDLVFGLSHENRGSDLHAKRLNSLEVKKHMVKEMTGEDFTLDIQPWDTLTLRIPEDLREELDRKLIIEDDLKEAIYLAETTGDKFVDDEDGVSQCSMVKSALTYWVQYKPAGPDTYEVTSAWSHRMKFSREE